MAFIECFDFDISWTCVDYKTRKVFEGGTRRVMAPTWDDALAFAVTEFCNLNMTVGETYINYLGEAPKRVETDGPPQLPGPNYLIAWRDYLGHLYQDWVYAEDMEDAFDQSYRFWAEELLSHELISVTPISN